MEKYASKELGGVLHCFNASAHLLPLANMNFYFGIGGVVTFKNSKLGEVIKNIDLSDIVLETDSPYLTPEPFRGRQNSSKYLKYIALKIADLKNISIDEVNNVTINTTKEVFNFR